MDGGLFRERPREHELRLEDCLGPLYTAIEGGGHPAQHRMANMPLDVRNHLARIGLIPAPIKVLRDQTELDDEIAGQVLRCDLAALFPPKP